MFIKLIIIDRGRLFMKSIKIITVFSIFLLLIMFIGTVSAVDSLNLNQNGVVSLNENINGEYTELDVSSNYLKASQESSLDLSIDDSQISSDSTSSGKTITIVADKSNPNQVLNPTVQPVLDSANSTDTIILKGDFVHCHFTINKTLNIIASKSSLDPCPHHKHDDVDEFGIFYINENGSGSVIQGFNFHNNDRAETPFTVLIRGASNVTIKDCTVNYADHGIDKISGIIIENSNNITLSNLVMGNTIYGIRLINSSNILIANCTLSNNENYAISVVGNSRNISVIDNRIIGNGNSGINLSRADNILIINNYFENNGNENDDCGCGIYVNTNITKLLVKGNIFLRNSLHAIMYDYRARNLNNQEGADLLTVVDNNYFAGHNSMVLHHRHYIEYPNGNYNYDENNDVFVNVENGSYVESKLNVYMQHAFIEGDIICGFTYYTTEIPWALESQSNNGRYDLSLTISNITQVRKGVYQVSIVNHEGNIADDFNSFDVRFYLNNFSKIDAAENETYIDVRIQNGTATVDFTDLKDKYLESGNIITASFPGLSRYVNENPHVQLKIDDNGIPGVVSQTEIKADIPNIVYGSGDKITAIITDNFGKSLSNKEIKVSIGGKENRYVSDDNGQIQVPVGLACGSYDVIFSFEGDDENNATSTSAKIVVSNATPKITSSSLTTYPLSEEYFTAKLVDNNGKALKNQKITFKINGKTLTAKINANGIAKIKISLTGKKTYSVTISYAGNSNFKAISKNGKVIVKIGSKKSKITSSNIKVKKNAKKTFSFKLTGNGKAISKQKVTVKLNGKTHIVKTNSKGIAKLTVKLPSAKKYKVVMKFLGNKNYKAASKTSYITVTKK